MTFSTSVAATTALDLIDSTLLTIERPSPWPATWPTGCGNAPAHAEQRRSFAQSEANDKELYQFDTVFPSMLAVPG